MARLTVEQKWWIDPRRTFLMNLLSTPAHVDGLMIQVWRMAQEYWGQGQLMPWRVFSKFPEAPRIIDADLAELRDGIQLDSKTLPALPQDTSNTFVYVRGSKDFFSWVFEIREKRRQGGKQSAQRERDEKGRLLKKGSKGKKKPSKNPAPIQDSSSSPPAQSNTVQVSGSGSDSGLGSNTGIMNPSDSCAEAQAGEKSPGGDERNPGDPPNACQVFIGTYAKAYEAKYHFRPEVVLAEAGAAKNIVKALGLQKALLFIPTFLSMTDSWFLTKRHSLCAMVSNLNAIKQFHQTGKVTSINANGGRKKTAFERDEDIDAEMQKLLSGEAAHG